METMTDLIIKRIYGNAPVQGEGTIAGKPFYFRARHGGWSMSIGVGMDKPDADDKDAEWFREGEWPNASWMPHEDARKLIEQLANEYIGS